MGVLYVTWRRGKEGFYFLTVRKLFLIKLFLIIMMGKMGKDKSGKIREHPNTVINVSLFTSP